MANDFAENLLFAHATGNQLRILRAEIKHQYPLGGNLRRSHLNYRLLSVNTRYRTQTADYRFRAPQELVASGKIALRRKAQRDLLLRLQRSQQLPKSHLAGDLHQESIGLRSQEGHFSAFARTDLLAPVASLAPDAGSTKQTVY